MEAITIHGATVVITIHGATVDGVITIITTPIITEEVIMETIIITTTIITTIITTTGIRINMGKEVSMVQGMGVLLYPPRGVK